MENVITRENIIMNVKMNSCYNNKYYEAIYRIYFDLQDAVDMINIAFDIIDYYGFDINNCNLNTFKFILSESLNKYYDRKYISYDIYKDCINKLNNYECSDFDIHKILVL